MAMDLAADSSTSPQKLGRSVSTHSSTSLHSHRSITNRGGTSRGCKLASQPTSSASSIAPSDKSLTSFPSFSPESPSQERFEDQAQKLPRGQNRGKRAATQGSATGRMRATGRKATLDSLTGEASARSALFEDAPLSNNIPGALHQADDDHIERLVSRHGAVELVRQIAEDLAQRDAQISHLRRKADERERALRRIVRECGLSNLDLETRLRAVESELRMNGKASRPDNSGLTDLMSDAMQDTFTENAHGETNPNSSTIRAASQSVTTPNMDYGRGTSRGWKDYFWGQGTSKRGSQAGSANGSIRTNTVVRSQSSMDRRPTLNEDLFNPPEESSVRSSSRASSITGGPHAERKASTSLASLALRLVAGGAISTRDAESRGRAVSTSTRSESTRGLSTASRASKSTRAVSVAGGPKALMAMRRGTPTPQAAVSTKSSAQDMWKMSSSPPDSTHSRQENYGPVEMDAILPPELQPPTLTHIYNNFPNSEFLTDRFGFIYDQRRKKRQREAAQMTRHMRKGSRTEMLINGRAGGISPNLLDDIPSPSSEGRSESPNSMEEQVLDEGRPKKWQDYLKIATFPTELLSHTPSMAVPSLEVLEGAEALDAETRSAKSPAITPTDSGLVPLASTTTAIDAEIPQPPTQTEPTGSVALAKEDAEPVKLLLAQLSDVHDSLQREKTVRWNDFLRKVRAERKREGDAAIAAAAAAAEARCERPTMILPETRVADGEMIGVSGLGNKGKVGRAKWNEFKNLVLGGIPVAYRAKVWSECSGAAALRVPGYYEYLVAQSEKDDDPAIVSQIQMDINRTLTDNIFFRKGPGVQKLSEVLLAYSRRNKDVGYCQGMNLIAANLLLIMPAAEDVFWVLTSIIENILPHGYYDHSLRASRADQQVLRQYVKSVLPKLSAHLDSLQIELEALTFQWFLSVFTDCLSAEALFRVWDVVLCTNDGSTFLFQVALALLKLNEGNLLQCSSPSNVYTYINHHMTEHAISIDGLMQASEGLRKVVRREDVESRRDKVICEEMEMMARRDSASSGSRRSRMEEVDESLTNVEPQPLEV